MRKIILPVVFLLSGCATQTVVRSADSGLYQDEVLRASIDKIYAVMSSLRTARYPYVGFPIPDDRYAASTSYKKMEVKPRIDLNQRLSIQANGDAGNILSRFAKRSGFRFVDSRKNLGFWKRFSWYLEVDTEGTLRDIFSTIADLLPERAILLVDPYQGILELQEKG